MTEGWGPGDELVLALLSDSKATSDPHLLRSLCVTAAAMIREQQEAISRLRTATERRPRGRPRGPVQPPRNKRPAGRPPKYPEVLFTAVEELQRELRSAGKRHTDLITARTLIERHDRRKTPLSRAELRDSERFARRLAKLMSARRNRRPKTSK
jgi:hypothetical protein